MSIFFFTTLCLNLWEERELLNFMYEKELNESNSNRERSGNYQNTDEFKKSNTNKNPEKPKKNGQNLPYNEEEKVKNSLGIPEKI